MPIWQNRLMTAGFLNDCSLRKTDGQTNNKTKRKSLSNLHNSELTLIETDYIRCIYFLLCAQLPSFRVHFKFTVLNKRKVLTFLLLLLLFVFCCLFRQTAKGWPHEGASSKNKIRLGYLNLSSVVMTWYWMSSNSNNCIKLPLFYLCNQ